MKTTVLKRRFTATALAALFALQGPPTRAEDIDIFTAGAGTTPKPNVLIILDSSSNWNATLGTNECDPTGAKNTKFDAEVCALTQIVPNLSANVRLGLMMFAESGNNGAYVRFGIRDMNATNKPAMVNMISNFVRQGSGTDNSGSNQPYAKAMYEAFKYFGGYTSPLHAKDDVAGSPVNQTSFGGLGPSTSIAFAGGPDNDTGSHRRDYNGNNSGGANQATGNRAAAKYNADSNYAFSSSTANTYNSPILDACAKNIIIFISNGNPSTGGDSSTNPARDTALLTNVGATTQAIPTAATETHPSKMDEFALFLNQTDVSAQPGQQKVLTYTIGVYQPSAITYDNTTTPPTVTSETISNTDQQMVNLMKSASTAGGGKYFAGRDAASVKNAISQILNEVQAVNSVFVSASLPVSVNNQGTFLNQIYMGMFRPDGSGAPRWLGNVKEFQFILDATTGQLFLGDSTAQRAVNPFTGFLSPGAISFWTTRGTNPAVAGWPNRDFWINSQSGTPPSGSDSPDGEIVEKGGAAEMQRIDYATTQTARKVYSCLSGCGSNGVTPDFLDNSTASYAAYGSAFGVASSAEMTFLIDWIRGQDNTYGQTSVAGTAPCTVGSASCTTWYSNEGGPGWPATVRPSVHGDVLHSRPVVLNYTSMTGCSTNGCPYVFYGANDGTLRAIKGGTDGHEQWAFVAPEFFGKFRRLRNNSPELRTPGTPPDFIPETAPKDYFFDGPIGAWEDPNGTTKWIFVTARRGGAVIYAFDVTDPTTPKFKWKKTRADLPNLGQTWSLPWAFKLTGDSTPTLLFGAGYDRGEDSTPVVNNGYGRGFYVLDADTGALKRFIDTDANGVAFPNDIPSDIALLSTGANQVYRGYVGDMGGNVWRLDIPSNDVASWKVFKFASLGPTKKFFYAPDLVHAGAVDVVLLGSGDREKPLDGTTADTFYGLYDAQPAVTAATSVSTVATTSLQSLSGTSGTSGCTAPTCLGWYRDLAVGEKVVNSPLTVAGVTYFSTNKPVPNVPGSCATNLGEAKAYGVDFSSGGAPQNKTSISTTLTGGGLPPSPVGGVVQLNDGQLVTFVIGAGDSGSAIETGRVTLTIPKTRRKVYWNSKTDT